MSAPQPGRLLRCGRTDQPPMHLIEADDSILSPSWRIGARDYVGLCGAELGEETPTPDFDEVCPGCVDCSRYCRRCVEVAVAYSEPAPAEVHVGWLRVPDLVLTGRG